VQGLPSDRREREERRGACPERCHWTSLGIGRRRYYTPTNKNSGLTWDEASFREYIKDPRAKVSGTKMTFAGIKDEKINDLVAYLKQFDASGKKVAQ
jgi:cytochrome c1